LQRRASAIRPERFHYEQGFLRKDMQPCLDLGIMFGRIHAPYENCEKTVLLFPMTPIPELLSLAKSQHHQFFLTPIEVTWRLNTVK